MLYHRVAMHFIHLDSPFGSKSLYSNASGICEFFSIAPESGWKLVAFASSEKAWSFIEKKYQDCKAVYACESFAE